MAGNDGDSDSSSDYEVELHVKPKRVRRPVNDDTADLLGNFDDEKRKEIFEGTYVDKEIAKNPSDSDSSDDAGSDPAEDNDDAVDQVADAAGADSDASASEEEPNADGRITSDQLNSLLRGASKVNRHVLYVTNLNFETTKDDLESHFAVAGTVKSIRIPKKRRGGFAFVEMVDLAGFQQAFQLHNTELQGRKIKVQISEAGKKKSANKKNIIKQKNRKLAEMRNEQKTFTKSGKFYDKDLKKEKAKELLARKRWRKPKAK
ncbi:polyadenylate-binding protein 3 [Drosophila novamexicana]|uniref:polyadenylate-binding protein 3 n=1 Tax=Drosophila novamexicana TaxID=47314 RepID=UPI0011E5DFAB|nr:polyadenylate-binding protein 3 [Drosophila novamexicana]